MLVHAQLECLLSFVANPRLVAWLVAHAPLQSGYGARHLGVANVSGTIRSPPLCHARLMLINTQRAY